MTHSDLLYVLVKNQWVNIQVDLVLHDGYGGKIFSNS